jgi:hypothetical protein
VLEGVGIGVGVTTGVGVNMGVRVNTGVGVTTTTLYIKDGTGKSVQIIKPVKIANVMNPRTP